MSEHNEAEMMLWAHLNDLRDLDKQNTAVQPFYTSGTTYWYYVFKNNSWLGLKSKDAINRHSYGTTMYVGESYDGYLV